MSTWGFPTAPSLQFQVNGTAQSGVTTVNAPAGSTVSNGVLTLAGSSTPSAGSSPFAIGTDLVLSATGLTAPRTFTWPDSTDTVVTLAAAQTLASKTLTAPVVAGLTASGSTAIDFSGSSGAFKFPSGGVTNAIALAAGLTASGSVAFDFSGSSGAFKFPSGGVTNTPAFAAGWTASGSTAFDLSGSTGTWKPPTGGFNVNIVPATDNTFAVGSTGAKLSRVFAYNFYGALQTVAAATSLTLNPASGEHIRITLSGTAITSLTVTAGVSAEMLTVEVIQDASGSRTIPTTWTNVKFAGGSYTATTTLNKRDVLTFRYDNTDSAWVEVSRAMNV